jgi:hypothetical protein
MVEASLPFRYALGVLGQLLLLSVVVWVFVYPLVVLLYYLGKLAAGDVARANYSIGYWCSVSPVIFLSKMQVDFIFPFLSNDLFSSLPIRSNFPLCLSSFIFRLAVLILIFNRSLISVAVILLFCFIK